MPVTNSHHHCSWLSYTIAMIGEYVTNCCLYSAHKLCRTTWHSGLLAQLEQQLLWEFVAFHTSNDSKSLWTHVEEMMDLWAIVKNTLKLPPALIAQQISPTFHMGLVLRPKPEPTPRSIPMPSLCPVTCSIPTLCSIIAKHPSPLQSSAGPSHDLHQPSVPG